MKTNPSPKPDMKISIVKDVIEATRKELNFLYLQHDSTKYSLEKLLKMEQSSVSGENWQRVLEMIEHGKGLQKNTTKEIQNQKVHLEAMNLFLNQLESCDSDTCEQVG